MELYFSDMTVDSEIFCLYNVNTDIVLFLSIKQYLKCRVCHVSATNEIAIVVLISVHYGGTLTSMTMTNATSYVKYLAVRSFEFHSS